MIERLTTSKAKDGTVLETSDYYPFGLQVARGQTVISPENRYKYNGKELQMESGLGQYDYGARFYDPVVGSWNVVDPKAEKYRGLSPYNYVANNPLIRTDPTGSLDGEYTEEVDEEGNVRRTKISDLGGIKSILLTLRVESMMGKCELNCKSKMSYSLNPLVKIMPEKLDQ